MNCPGITNICKTVIKMVFSPVILHRKTILSQITFRIIYLIQNITSLYFFPGAYMRFFSKVFILQKNVKIYIFSLYCTNQIFFQHKFSYTIPYLGISKCYTLSALSSPSTAMQSSGHLHLQEENASVQLLCQGSFTSYLSS